MFPDSSPIDPSPHVQSGNFHLCGQIVPPPCFPELCSYEAGLSEVDIMNITKEQLTAKEVKLLDLMTSDCVNYSDLILDHGYTSQISNEHVEAIIWSLKASFVSCCCLYMKELMIGSQLYGLGKIIHQKPSLCQLLFINGYLKKGLVPFDGASVFKGGDLKKIH